jgi:hypothetical protein
MSMRMREVVAAGVLSLLTTFGIHAVEHRRALLIGINDYTASHLGVRRLAPAPGRDWPNLAGAVNDVRILKEMLPLLYGFAPGDIVTIVDQDATRVAILDAIKRHLVEPASKGDVFLFYYAGHGSQVRNSLSDEPDKLDESLVPADSRLGAPDIRDKELRRLFNQILDRGARLTVILDNCHSGSGARGLPTGARPRGVEPDLRDVKDGSPYGPRPENRGALVLSASQDADNAWETRDSEHTFHGVFSWAWIRSLRDSLAGEAAVTTFLRAEARMRAETPFQDPVLAGESEARLSPFLGASTRRSDRQAVIAVMRVRSDGTVTLRGGWANGLSVGSELRVAGDPQANVRLRIIAITGLGRSEATVTEGHAISRPIRPGTLLEAVAWLAPSPKPLRVWMPRITRTPADITVLARTLAERAAAHGVRWVTNPLDVAPAKVLRWGEEGWELVGQGKTERLGRDAAVISAIARMPAGLSLFVQLPAPIALIDALEVGPGSAHQEIEVASQPDEADYILVGRYAGRRLTYCWLRPATEKKDGRKTGLPLRSDWVAAGGDEQVNNGASRLRDAAERLRTIHDWQLLETPPGADFPYHLALRRSPDNDLPIHSVVTGGSTYSIVLRAGTAMLPTRLKRRYVYVFVIDSYGKSSLLFPRSGSVENRFPLSEPPPSEIALGPSSEFVVEAPYGVDNYFLLSTEEPLPNPWILEWEGVRTRNAQAATPLGRLLAQTGSGPRAVQITTPLTWSIDCTLYESVPSRMSHGSSDHATRTN